MAASLVSPVDAYHEDESLRHAILRKTSIGRDEEITCVGKTRYALHGNDCNPLEVGTYSAQNLDPPLSSVKVSSDC